MAVNTNVPQSGQSLGETQSVIQTNFSDISDRFDVNHIPYNNTGGGKHNFLQMPEQAVAPTTLANEAGFYSKEGTNPAESNIFFRGENNGFEYQLTHAVSASTTEFGTNTNYTGTQNGGWTFLPGGLILQYGRETTPVNNGTVTFPLVFPSGNAPFSITIGNERFQTFQISSTITSSGFEYTGGFSGSSVVNWIAIGN